MLASPMRCGRPRRRRSTSERYARDYEEVGAWGSDSKERTPDETLIARYRQALRHDADGAPGCRRAGPQLSRQCAFVALYQMANDDAMKAMVWPSSIMTTGGRSPRSATATRDGNPRPPDPAWVPLIDTPNFRNIRAAIADWQRPKPRY